ncbi:hypothetical protein [Viridibacterium curvum]|uniref:Uncharacterized protein n=1 Tax=Viridibacterium curvum TaxID=1101404 RepID=A0ABP9QFJ5_9RHOO
MHIDPEIAQTRPAVLMASIIHLLSCSALHGLSIAKCRSLSQLLGALAEGADVDPLLRKACHELTEAWYAQAVVMSHDAVFEEAQAQAVSAWH